jgi:hypothetical protein
MIWQLSKLAAVVAVLSFLAVALSFRPQPPQCVTAPPPPGIHVLIIVKLCERQAQT